MMEIDGLNKALADAGFTRRGRQPQSWGNFPRKLHENEMNNEREGRVPNAPLGSANVND